MVKLHLSRLLDQSKAMLCCVYNYNIFSNCLSFFLSTCWVLLGQKMGFGMVAIAAISCQLGKNRPAHYCWPLVGMAVVVFPVGRRCGTKVESC